MEHAKKAMSAFNRPVENLGFRPASRFRSADKDRGCYQFRIIFPQANYDNETIRRP